MITGAKGTVQDMNQIDVVLVDDHPLIHEAVKSLLAERTDISLVGQGFAGQELFPLLAEHEPDVLVLDLTMPQHQDDSPARFAYMQALAQLSAEHPSTATIILSQYLQSGIVQSAAEFGVRGYLLKSDNLSLNLPEAILAASRGGVFFSEAVSRELFGTGRKPTANLLSERQREVILAIAKKPDDSYATTASLLGIGENTLKGHLRVAFSQLDVTNITSCIIRCMQLNLIPFTVNPDGQGIHFGEHEDLVTLPG
jgi:DNA-binding NarL/FixJ family response regulator